MDALTKNAPRGTRKMADARARSRTATNAAGSPGADRLLGIYLNDHLAGSTVGVRLARRLAKGHREVAIGTELAALSEDIDADRAVFISILERLGIPRRRYKVVAGWCAELVGRAKANGRILGRSPLSSVVELEMLRLGVEGKRLGWLTLRTVARLDPELHLDPAEFDALAERAVQQAARLDELRTAAIRDALSRTAATPNTRPDHRQHD